MSELRRVQVWSPLLRATHWAIASAVLVLLVSGWLLARGHDAADPVWLLGRDLHVPAGQALAIAVALRLGLLLVGRASDGWRDLLPRRAQIEGLKGMLRFYLSGGRAALPGYYGHNPLWGPIYLGLLALLLAQTLAGLWMEIGALQERLALSYAGVLALHRSAASLILGLTLAHLVAVLLHDWRGRRWEISAMINGEKVFEIQRPPKAAQIGVATGPGVRFDSIRHWRPPGSGR